MTETETNQNEAGDSQKPEQVEQAKAMEMEAKEAVETVKEEAENDLKKEFPFAEPTVLKGRNFSFWKRFHLYFANFQNVF